MYNRIILAGNLGRDPELRYTSSGQAVCNLSLATNEVWTDKAGERQERTIWWRVAVWGKQGEACNQYLSKGRQVLVEGRMNPDPDTGNPRIFTRQDGTTGASFDVVAQTVRFLGAGAGSTESGPAASNAPPPTREEDIPF